MERDEGFEPPTSALEWACKQTSQPKLSKVNFVSIAQFSDYARRKAQFSEKCSLCKLTK
jgi:hypothetical protein